MGKPGEVTLWGSQVKFALDTISSVFPGEMAKKIKKGRSDKGLTRKMFAERTKQLDVEGEGLNEDIIKDIESGRKKRINLREKRLIEEVLGVDL